MSNSKNDRTEIKVRCSVEEWTIIKKRADLAGLSISRYLLECGFNVQGIENWQQRIKLIQLLANLLVLSNELLGRCKNKEFMLNDHLTEVKDEIEKLNKGLDHLLYLYEVNLFDKEQEIRLQEEPFKMWNYFTIEGQGNNL